MSIGDNCSILDNPYKYNGKELDRMHGLGETTGNCNTSISAILSKSGVRDKILSKIESEIPGISWGFGKIKPWTKTVQKAEVQKRQKRLMI